MMGSKKRVLIVDDEKDFAFMVKLNLEQNGQYEVETVNEGSRAIPAIKTFKPDLVLLDIVMPDLDGSYVAGQLKQDPATSDIPIVFLTAAITKEEEDSKNGMIDGYPFLAKPVKLENLVKSIEEHIKK